MANAKTGAVNDNLSDLPYLGEYLSAVLQPRVERAIDELRASLTEAAWTELVRLIGEEQPGEVSEESVRQLLASTLGLEISVDVAATFHGEAAAGGADVVDPANPADPANREVEQVEVRRRGGRPLVNAVLRGDSGKKS